MRSIFLALFLSGCAVAPVGVPVPPADTAACEAIASQRQSAAPVVGALAEGAKGAAIGSTVNGARITFAGIGTAAVSVGSFIVPFAIFGAIDGLKDDAKERSRIVRECLRDRGYKVY